MFPIKTIIIYNFGPITNATIECDNKSIALVGSNGSGKTNVLQAISLCLYGKVAKGLTINSFIGPNDTDFNIKLIFSDNTILERTSKKSKMIFTNGTILTKLDDIYKALGFDIDLAFNLTYVKQHEIASFFEGNSTMMSKLLALLVDIKKLENGYNIVRDKLKEVTSELNILEKINETDNIFEENIEEINNAISKYQSLLETANIDISKEELEEQEMILNSIREIETKILTYKEEMVNAQSQFKTLDYDEEQLIEQLNTFNRINELKDKITTVNNRLANLKLFKTQVLPAAKEYFAIDTKLLKIEKTNDELIQIKENKEIVFKYMTSDAYTDINTATTLLTNVVDNWNITADKILEAKEKYNKLVKTLTTPELKELVILYKGNTSAEDLENKVENDLKTLETLLNDSITLFKEEERKPNISFDTYNEKQTILKNNKNNYKIYEEYAKKYDEYNIKLKNLQRSLLYNEQTIREYNQLYINKNDIELTLNMYKEKLNDYNKKQQVITDRLIRIEQLINQKEKFTLLKEVMNQLPKVLRHLIFEPIVDTINVDFYSLFSFQNLGRIIIDWEKLSINVGDKSYASMSGAQTIILSLVLRLALLKRLGSFIPVMLLDEPTDSLDSERIGDLKTFLNILGSKIQLFISTHDVNIIDVSSTKIYNTAYFK